MRTGPNQHRIGELLRGENKSRYVIRETITSSGKNALLYRVSRLPDHETFAAKFYCERVRVHRGPGLGTSAQRAFRRFKKEAKFLRLFRHPGIVAFEDEYYRMDSHRAGSDKCFFIMEYLTGISLQSAIQQRSFDRADMIEIASAITAAVAAIHDCQVVHRDLHPGNVFLVGRQPKIIDFGCAIDLDPVRSITRPHIYDGIYDRLVGPWHTPPDAQDPSSARTESDVFALGVTILELATQSLIHGRQTPLSENVRSDRLFAMIDSLREDYSVLFCQLLREMTDSAPNGRPAAHAVLRRLNTLESDLRSVGYSLSRSSMSNATTSREHTSVTLLRRGLDLLGSALNWMRQNPTKTALGAVVVGGAAWLLYKI